ncbi:hypothetical protein VTL71DRAFT_13997 [Oculimacula yallundae]|uniref:Heterokaryon incompatibility domain-containing protein n=1 Tax=Oculimacula yallundae TaxID=86028 RepID=A0ABR4CNK0_9HELO
MRCALCAGIKSQALATWVDDDDGHAQRRRYAHQPSFSALQLSAASGCDLCSLFEKHFILETGSLQTLEDLIEKHGTLAITLDTEHGYIDDQAARCKHIFGRAVPIDPLGDECIDTVQFWIQQCLDRHEDWVDPPVLSLTKGQRGSYFALSHCWGGRETTTTTKATFRRPKTRNTNRRYGLYFRDAVILSRKLGSRYLWIDTLCIIQDDIADWTKESAQMGHIYSNAKLTIAASIAKDSQQGVLQKRGLCSVGHALASMVYQDECMEKEGTLYIRLYDRSRWVTEVELGILNTRGWTMQERLLSSRTLHFGESQIDWECHTITDCEGGMGSTDHFFSKTKLDICEIIRSSEKRDLGKENHPHDEDVKDYLDQEEDLRDMTPKENDLKVEKEGLYKSTIPDGTLANADDVSISNKPNVQVEDHLANKKHSDQTNIANIQAKDLANREEKLVELEIGKRLCPSFQNSISHRRHRRTRSNRNKQAIFNRQQTNDEHLADIWRKDLLHGLLWRGDVPMSSTSSPTISPSATSNIKNVEPKLQYDDSKRSYIAPTWSWASFNGSVEFWDRPEYFMFFHAKVLDGGSTARATGAVSAAFLVLETDAVVYLNAQYHPRCKERQHLGSLVVENEAGAKEVIDNCFMDQCNPPKYPQILLATIERFSLGRDREKHMYALVVVPSFNADGTAAYMQYEGGFIPVLTRVGMVRRIIYGQIQDLSKGYYKRSV